jgi:glucosamine 6-phosphate synthetase-like amidotransferase/phosphosugar isomerase protein
MDIKRHVITQAELINKYTERIMVDYPEADKIHIIAAGTSMHAGLIGKQLFEKMASIPVEVHIASEFVEKLLASSYFIPVKK